MESLKEIYFVCLTALEQSNSRIQSLQKTVEDYQVAQEDIANQKRKAEELEAQLAEAANRNEEERVRLVCQSPWKYQSLYQVT